MNHRESGGKGKLRLPESTWRLNFNLGKIAPMKSWTERQCRGRGAVDGDRGEEDGFYTGAVVSFS